MKGILKACAQGGEFGCKGYGPVGVGAGGRRGDGEEAGIVLPIGGGDGFEGLDPCEFFQPCGGDRWVSDVEQRAGGGDGGGEDGSGCGGEGLAQHSSALAGRDDDEGVRQGIAIPEEVGDEIGEERGVVSEEDAAGHGGMLVFNCGRSRMGKLRDAAATNGKSGRLWRDDRF